MKELLYRALVEKFLGKTQIAEKFVLFNQVFIAFTERMVITVVILNHSNHSDLSNHSNHSNLTPYLSILSTPASR